MAVVQSERLANKQQFSIVATGRLAFNLVSFI